MKSRESHEESGKQFITKTAMNGDGARYLTALDSKEKSMENFADFIVDYIENNEIYGHKGWLNQLNRYLWKSEKYPDAIDTARRFNIELRTILNSPDNEKWFDICDKIRDWGGMKEISCDMALSLRNSVNFLIKMDPGINCDFSEFPIRGDRIATTSKVYYYSDPLRWTIYDSRVGFALNQLLIEYSKKLGVDSASVFPDIPLCLPDSQTTYPNSQIKKRVPLSTFSLCGSETKARISFLWTSHLHRLISTKLNLTSIPKPEYSLSISPHWELPHVEMVFLLSVIRSGLTPRVC